MPYPFCAQPSLHTVYQLSILLQHQSGVEVTFLGGSKRFTLPQAHASLPLPQKILAVSCLHHFC